MFLAIAKSDVVLVGQVAEAHRGDLVALADRGDELVDCGHGGGVDRDSRGFVAIAGFLARALAF